jgi:HlyD family secretion protein
MNVIDRESRTHGDTLLFILASALLAVLTVGSDQFVARAAAAEAAAQSFPTATVTRGDVPLTLTCDGTVEPEEVIEVGAEVAGRIVSLGRDPREPTRPVDSGSVVEAGTELARIDDSVYQADVALAQASCQRSEAELRRVQVKLAHAARRQERAKELVANNNISTSDLDQAQCDVEVAKANVAVAEAAIAQSRAGLDLAQKRLSSTRILAPVRGVILTRRANVGQTVSPVANAPCLFSIAQDRLQIRATVAEDDIGLIRPGQAVRFAVSTCPNESLCGKVGRIRLNATKTQDVVTYTVAILPDKSDPRVLPYLTAHVRIEAECRQNVLNVPNTALRWWPQLEWVAPDVRDQVEQLTHQRLGRRRGESGTKAAEAAARKCRVWIPDGQFVRPFEVQTGITDGTVTELTGGEVKEHMGVVVGNPR